MPLTFGPPRQHYRAVGALHRALTIVQLTNGRQAALSSYADDFHYFAVASILTVPIAFAPKNIASGCRVAAH
ncbi:MAG: hypothetical protein KGL75_14695 [Acidobacteriota bacterium]|nr:hypothetical protein [Acidobacteriota bacterium]